MKNKYNNLNNKKINKSNNKNKPMHKWLINYFKNSNKAN